MKLYTEKFVRSLSKEDRRKLCKESAEMAKHYEKCHLQTIKLMHKQTGMKVKSWCNDPVWTSHPMFTDLSRLDNLKCKHDANTRLLRDL